MPRVYHTVLLLLLITPAVHGIIPLLFAGVGWVAGPAIVSTLGFGAGGIAAGSTAAGMMSVAATIGGGGVAAGGVVAGLQAAGAGATGAVLAVKAVGAAVGTGVAYAATRDNCDKDCN